MNLHLFQIVYFKLNYQFWCAAYFQILVLCFLKLSMSWSLIGRHKLFCLLIGRRVLGWRGAESYTDNSLRRLQLLIYHRHLQQSGKYLKNIDLKRSQNYDAASTTATRLATATETFRTSWTYGNGSTKTRVGTSRLFSLMPNMQYLRGLRTLFHHEISSFYWT